MKLLFKISTIVLFVIVSVLAIFSYEQIKEERKILSSILDKQGELLKSTISAGLIEPILIDDYPYIDSYLGNVMNNYEAMYYISIVKNENEISSVVNSKLKNYSTKTFVHDIRVYGNKIASMEFAISTKFTDEIIERKIKSFLIIISIVSLFLIASLLFVIKTFLIQYIEKLKKHTAVIGSGNYDNKLIISTNDEFEDLANSINEMSKNINIAKEKSLELTKKLEQQKRDLILANKAKDMFLANMSHELKTPLNSINVISDVMKRNRTGNLDEKQVKNLDIVNKCGRDLLHLINDVLDISKLEAGELQLQCETFNFREFIDDIDSMIRPQTKNSNINFQVNYDDSITYVYSDENRLKQILKNFLSNAIKFAQDGEIILNVKDENEFIKISVSDSGIGIEESKLAQIFDRFKQVDGSTTRKYGGTGLGLSISNELAKLLNGSISVTSKVNEGSTFTLRFPKNSDKVEIQDEIIIEDYKETELLFFTENIAEQMNNIISLKKIFNLKLITNYEHFIKKDKTSFNTIIVNSDKLTDEDIKTLNSICKKTFINPTSIDEIINDLKSS